MGGVAVAILTAILIGTLYLGREVFVPIALAVLLSFVLAPLVGLAAALSYTARTVGRQRRFARVCEYLRARRRHGNAAQSTCR